MEILFQQQPTPHTCVHACLSMVTGIPVGELVERLGDRGLTLEEEALILVENGLFPVLQSPIANNVFPQEGAYLVTVPSLNLKGGSHRVVVELMCSGYEVYDPNAGKEGKEFYPQDARGLRAFEVTYLNPYILRDMRRANVEAAA